VTDDEHDETAEVVAHAVAQERAAVVAWLRGSNDNRVLDYADAIERGEHRRKEKA